MLDLPDPQRLAAVGLGPEDVSDDDQSACQAIGHAAWFLEFADVFTSSAPHAEGFVLAAFEAAFAPVTVSPAACRAGERATWSMASA